MAEKKEKDITDQLIDEAAEVTKKEKELKEAASKKQSQTPEKKKNETIASQTPQDRFRSIVKDQGYSIGIENMTSVFFEGNTDNPSWLDEVLKLSHIPAKNREMIITAYYGKPIKELGIIIEPAFGGKTADEKKTEDIKKAASDAENELDIIKLSQDEIKETIKNEKTLLAIAQMKKMRKELERVDDDKKDNHQQQQQYQMRQVIRPVIRDGKMIYGKDGSMVTETVVEPVNLNQQGGGSSEIMNMLAIRALNPPEAPKQTTGDPALLDYIKKLDSKIEKMDSDRQIQAKEEEIKRLNDKLDRKEEEAKKEIDRKEKEFSEKLKDLNDERVRDLTELKERFQESMQHKKELDDIVGQISGQHKKEIDGLKQKLEHTQTNIERTIVSKGTETLDGVTKRVGSIAEDVVKPLAEVMKDHYRTVIDQTRAGAGLPPLKDSIPKVAEDELERFAKE